MNSSLLQAPAARPARQQGAATLIVVMILFFVVTLAAAYASRNLIFEQRTAANQYQSTSAQEAAEAGIEWAVTMLNSGRIDENCVASTDSSKDTFRQRYLSYDPAGKLLPRLPTSGKPVWSACVYDGSAWKCFCPDRDGALPNPLPAGTAAFAVRFKSKFAGLALERRGVIRVEVNGCSSNSLDCLRAIRSDPPVTCQSTACTLLAQFPALKIPPIAAITTPKGAPKDVGPTSGRLEVYNPDPQTGFTIHAGSIDSTNLVVGGAPGVPPEQTKIVDPTKLAALEADAADCDQCMFSSVFGLRPETYKQQQAVVKVDCGTAGCTSAGAASALGKALAAARGSSYAQDSLPSTAFQDRGSVVWLSGGGLTLNAASDVIGSPDAPVTLIVEGPLKITGPAKIFGDVYAKSAALDYGPGAAAPDEATIRGALIAAEGVTANGTAANPGRVIYDSGLIERASLFNGTFARVPSSWRDFR